MSLNPYQSPTEERNRNVRRSTAKEHSLAGILLLLIGAAVGGIIGNCVGTLVAKFLWGPLPPGLPGKRPFLEISDLFAIKHPLGLVLLVVGAFVGAVLSKTWPRRSRERHRDEV